MTPEQLATSLARWEKRMHEGKLWYSGRGMPLVWVGEPRDVPVLTVENYLKWYGLQLILPEGKVEDIGFPELELPNHEPSRSGDGHVPNPRAVLLFARLNNYYLDDRAYEMMIGRWVCERDEAFWDGDDILPPPSYPQSNLEAAKGMRCSACKEVCDPMSPTWRWCDGWEHRCLGLHPQVGYFKAEKIP